jgi:predicted SnoaL-like aldol condensation-catalyzing enzyme
LRSPLLAETGDESVPYPFRSQMAKVQLAGVLRSSHQTSSAGIMIAPEWDALEGGPVSDVENNKQTVIAYYNMAFNERKPAEAAQKYGGPHYIQHNPQAPDGFEAFVGFVEGFAEQFPQMSLEIKRALAEGDMVVTHSLLKTSPEDLGTAVADFFRLEDGKVVEHWDVVQPIPESAANDHPMF